MNDERARLDRLGRARRAHWPMTTRPAPFDPNSELVRLCLDASPVGLAMFDREMRYLATSRSYREAMGAADQDLVGLCHYDVFPETIRWRDVHQRCLAGAEEHSDDDVLTSPSAVAQQIEWDCRPWIDATGHIGGLVLFMTDITESARQQREARVWFKAIQHTGVGVTIVDSTTNLSRYVNPRFAEMHGLTQEQAKGQSILETYAPADRAMAAENLAAASRDGHVVFEAARARADGTTFPALMAITVVKHTDGTLPYRVGSILDITEQKREQDAARAMDEQCKQYIVHAPVAVFVADASMTIAECNPAAAAMFGDGLIGQSLPVLHRPEDLPRVAHDLEALRGGRHLQREYRMRRADGSTPWMALSVGLLPDGSSLGFVQDIDDLRQAELARGAAEADLFAAVQLGPGVLYRARITGPDLHIDSVHGDISRISLSAPSSGEPGDFVLALLRQPDNSGLLHRIAQDAQQTGGEADLPLIDPDGNARWVRNTLRVTARTPEQTAIAGYLTDVTREKTEQQRLHQMTTLVTLGEMATGIAHELKQPLSSISFAAQNAAFHLNRTPPDLQAVGGKVTKIVGEARRAARLIEHMQVFARNERQSFQPVRWGAALAGALEILGPRLRSFALIDGVPADLPAVLGSAILMEQVLINLIGNALDAYADRNTTPQLREVTVAGSIGGDSVVLRVSDHAGGIAPGALGRVFEPFFTTKAPGKGTGLGLAVCFGTVIEMGGTLSAENANGGAVFEIRLPRAVAAAGV